VNAVLHSWSSYDVANLTARITTGHSASVLTCSMDLTNVFLFIPWCCRGNEQECLWLYEQIHICPPFATTRNLISLYILSVFEIASLNVTCIKLLHTLRCGGGGRE